MVGDGRAISLQNTIYNLDLGWAKASIGPMGEWLSSCSQDARKTKELFSSLSQPGSSLFLVSFHLTGSGEVAYEKGSTLLLGVLQASSWQNAAQLGRPYVQHIPKS